MATDVCANPTSRDLFAENVKEDITISLFAKSAYVPLVVTDHATILESASVIQVSLEASVTAVQEGIMDFLSASLVTATPLARTVNNAIVPLASVHAGPTSGVVNATAVQRIWWASPRV